MEKEIVNRVSNSTLVLFNLEEYYHPGERVMFDLKDHLFQGMILRERDFRSFVKEHDWSGFAGKNVALTCSVDAIVPTWAYMLLASVIQPYANMVVFGRLDELEQALFKDALSKVDWEVYRGSKVVVKGCGKIPVPVYAYVEVTRILKSYAASIMYGEPCSTVPIFKQRG